MAEWKNLVIKDVTKRFDSGPCILSGIDIRISRGSFVCVLGPSGSGKSTLADLIAGFVKPSTGDILLDHEKVTGPGPDRVVIFQDFSNALFPWLTVAENVEFGLKKIIGDKAARRRKVLDTLGMVKLSDHIDKFPSELSGGMKQRTQIARGIVMNPDILLMDEPFGALDAITRRHLQDELVKIWEELGQTIIFITHDIGEALLISNRVLVLSSGPNAEIVEDFKQEHRFEDPSDKGFSAAYRRIENSIESSLKT
ncbi:MAG: nitrate ABC transporter ATP-binding protein [marine bacterium B5-7]|nr:MAG: nitrate ABC transporter ATP-binding protein [marine bacterium B5-7]